jgi:hypothetical protein
MRLVSVTRQVSRDTTFDALKIHSWMTKDTRGNLGTDRKLRACLGNHIAGDEKDVIREPESPCSTVQLEFHHIIIIYNNYTFPVRGLGVFHHIQIHI